MHVVGLAGRSSTLLISSSTEPENMVFTEVDPKDVIEVFKAAFGSSLGISSVTFGADL